MQNHRGKNMLSTLLIIFLCLNLASSSVWCLDETNKNSSLECRVGQSINHFGLQFLNHLQADDDNVIYSPISLATALFVVYSGTAKDSDSAGELSKVFGFDEFDLSKKKNRPHKGLHTICKHLNDLKTFEGTNIFGASIRANFTSANLFLSNKKELGGLKENFQKTLVKYYNITLAQFNTIDKDKNKFDEDVLISKPDQQFRNYPIIMNVSKAEQLVDAVNRWVSVKTHDKIGGIVNKDDIDLALLRAIIVNTVHFQASWSEPFFYDYKNDSLRHFYNRGKKDEKKRINYLSQRSGGHYVNYYSTFKGRNDAIETNDTDLIKGIHFKVLELPLAGDIQEQATSLVILLPRKIDGIHELEKALTWSKLKTIYSRLQRRMVYFGLPKFAFEQLYQARDILNRMGIKKMFTTEAKLSDMFKSLDTKFIGVDKVIHKAKIDVNEKGVEASAATAVSILLKAMPPPSATFHATHPFIFIIRHIESDTSLFMGRVFKL